MPRLILVEDPLGFLVNIKLILGIEIILYHLGEVFLKVDHLLAATSRQSSRSGVRVGFRV